MIKQRVLYIAAVTVSGFISVYYEMKTIPQRRNIRKIENIMKLNQAKTKNEEKIKSAQAKGQVHFCFVWKMGRWCQLTFHKFKNEKNSARANGI